MENTVLKTYIQYLSACGAAWRQWLYKISRSVAYSICHSDIETGPWFPDPSAYFFGECLCHQSGLVPSMKITMAGPLPLCDRYAGAEATATLQISSESFWAWRQVLFLQVSCLLMEGFNGETLGLSLQRTEHGTEFHHSLRIYLNVVWMFLS